MRRHMGIGRRLAPLLDGDRRLAELLHAVLFSLPGSPVIYYGDEILMGDNVYLGDRDSVRTPMQWSPDRNGGFSRADFAQLYSRRSWTPSTVRGGERRSASAQPQLASPLAPQHPADPQAVPVSGPVPSTGAMRQPVDPCVCPQPPARVGTRRSPPSNRALSPGVGRTETGRDNPVLCVHNLSRFAQPAELDLARWANRNPVELLGRIPFPPVGSGTYSVTLGPYGFYWFELTGEHDADPDAPGAGISGLLGDRRHRCVGPGAPPHSPISCPPTRPVGPAGKKPLGGKPVQDEDGGAAAAGGGAAVRVLDAEVLGVGRPGIIDVVAEWAIGSSTSRSACASPGEETRFIPDGDDAVLGAFVDDEGSAVVFDATRDAVVAAMLLERVSGEVVPPRSSAISVTTEGRSPWPWTTASPSRSSTRSSTAPARSRALPRSRRGSASTTWPRRWRVATGRRDLGVAQEYLAGASSGYALALTSVRDLYASGGPPELAGGDFGPRRTASAP